MPDTDRKIDRLEETIAHLARSNEELSGELALQWKRIEALEAVLKHFENRFSELEARKPDSSGTEKPPHW